MRKMELETRNYIAGEWCEGEGTVADINPSDLTDVIGHFAQGSAADLDRAVVAARDAQPKWWAAGIQRRHDALMQIGTELMARSAEIGALLSREEGKPLVEGKGEVYRAGQFFTWFAAESLRCQGDQAESVRPGVEVEVRREPVGVVAIVTPWNFPVATPSWKIAPALAYGNAVVWKPANLTPAAAVALAQVIAGAGLPAGTFNMVMGAGRDVGDRLVGHRDVAAVSFTGSVDVGQGIAARVLANRAKLQMEMGSKNPMLIMDDCDMELAVSHACNAAFGGTGQKCTAASRLIVHRKVLDEFTARLVQAAEALRVGHALAEGTQIGPVVSEGQMAANLAWVYRGRAEGAELLTGGQRLERPMDGYFMSPAVFARTANRMSMNREEMFAPITCIIPADSYADALAMANDTPFGLTAGIMTRSLARAAHFRANMRAGCVMVNLPTAGTDYHVPFGGRGTSSFGPREQGRYAAEFFTTVKTAYMAAGVPE